ncbi:MAG: von Willebrand factor type A domain-containing protein, partial [Planctomycetes bacterium]|nr:von Willebrand factor type A domain-containing protein [Planctomycetota bacterium]
MKNETNHSEGRGGCERFEPLLSAQLLGESEALGGISPAEIEAHLETCAECREEIELLRRALGAVREAAPAREALEPTRREAVILAARAAQPAPSRRSRSSSVRVLCWMTGLAAAAALAFLAFPDLRSFLGDSPTGGEELAMQTEPAMSAVPDGAVAPGRRALGRKPVQIGAESDREGAGAAAGARTAAPGAHAMPAGDAAAKAAEPGGPRSAIVLSADQGPEAADAAKPEAAADTLREMVSAETLQEMVSAMRAKDTGQEGIRIAGGVGAVHEVTRGEMLRSLADAKTPSLSLSRTEEILRLHPVKGEAERPPPAARPANEPWVRDHADRGGVSRSMAAGEDLRRSELAQQARQSASRRGPAPQVRGPIDFRGDSLVSGAPGGGAGGGQVAPDAAGRYQYEVGDGLHSGEKRDRANDLNELRAQEVGLAERPLAEQELADVEEVFGERAGADRRAGAEPAGDPSRTTIDPRVLVDDILSRLDRRAGETPDMMFFRYWGDNPFVEASVDNLSTFGVDVDTASYTLMRSYLFERGVLPPPEAIRTEEFVNYFPAKYDPPADGKDFAVHTDLAPSIFAHEPEYRLLRVGIKGREVARAERKACGLVFVVDTSGSMRQESRLELVKEALRLLVAELDEGDTIGIVAFSREARKVLDPVPASEKERILDAIATLQPQQNTNVDAGLQMGFAMAAEHRIAGGSNRVILLSDGVANTGVTDIQQMIERIQRLRGEGIYLTCVGVGMGNHHDERLEQLADRGNGQCVYVDRIEEARKVFVENLTGTLETIARDVKIQVDFDPEKVIRYRLLGYENRDIADHLFRDNKVDAGEVGAGHEVTALYELKLRPDSEGTVATVRLRYLTVDHGEAVELEHTVDAASAIGEFDKAPVRLRLAACVAELAEVLRDSYWARDGQLDRVAALTEELLSEDGGALASEKDAVELVALMKKADVLVRERRARTDEQAQIVDAIKENVYLRARLEAASDQQRQEDLRHLDELRTQ